MSQDPETIRRYSLKPPTQSDASPSFLISRTASEFTLGDTKKTFKKGFQAFIGKLPNQVSLPISEYVVHEGPKSAEEEFPEVQAFVSDLCNSWPYFERKLYEALNTKRDNKLVPSEPFPVISVSVSVPHTPPPCLACIQLALKFNIYTVSYLVRPLQSFRSIMNYMQESNALITTDSPAPAQEDALFQSDMLKDLFKSKFNKLTTSTSSMNVALSAEVFHKVVDIPVGLPSIMQYVRESRMPPPRALPPLRLLAEPKARAELFELVVKPIEEDEEYLARAKAKSFKQLTPAEISAIIADELRQQEEEINRSSESPSPPPPQRTSIVQREHIDIEPTTRKRKSFIRRAPDLQTWIPNSSHAVFAFGNDEHMGIFSLDDDDLTPEQRTMSEWASGRYYQKWCGQYFRPSPLPTETPEELGHSQFESHGNGSLFLLLSRSSACSFYKSGRLCTCVSYTKQGSYAWAFADSDKPILLASYSPLSGAVIMQKGSSSRIAALLLDEQTYVGFDGRGTPVRETQIRETMPSIILKVSEEITFIIESNSRIYFRVRIEDKNYTINVASMNKRQLYRPSTDQLVSQATEDLVVIKDKTASLLDKMKTMISTTEFMLEQRDETIKMTNPRRKTRSHSVTFMNPLLQDQTPNFSQSLRGTRPISPVRPTLATRPATAMTRPKTAMSLLQEERRRAVAEARALQDKSSVFKRERAALEAKQRAARPATAVVEKGCRHSVTTVTTITLQARPKSAPLQAIKESVDAFLCPLVLKRTKARGGDCSCERSSIPVITDDILDDLLRLAPRHQLIFIMLTSQLSTSVSTSTSVFEEFLLLTHRGQQSTARVNRPCAHLHAKPIRIFEYAIADPKNSLSTLQKRHGLSAGTFVVYGDGHPLMASKFPTERTRFKHEFAVQIDRCKELLSNREFLPKDFRFSV